MPVIRTITAERGIDIGGAPSTRIDNSVAEGLRAVGGAVSQQAEMQQALEIRRVQQQQQMQEFEANQEFIRLGDDMSASFVEGQSNIDPTGKGFTDNVSGVFNQRAETFIKNVPDALKPKFQELLETSRNQWVDRAAAAEVDTRNNWYRTGIADRQQTLQTEVFNDPSMFDAAKQDAYRQIESSGLPPIEKEALRKKTDEMFSMTLGEREIREAEANPNAATDAASRFGVLGVRGSGVDQFVDRIINVESGGNPNAKNPNSSASGLGQFIDSTWVATVKKHRPDIAGGLSNDEIIRLKTNGALSKQMTRAYAQDNARMLTSAGIPQTAGNIYLAHFLGPAGAVKALKADPNASVGAILGGDVVAANSFLKGKSISDLVAWSDKKMGSASGASSTQGSLPSDPRFSSLNLSQRLELYDKVNAAAVRGQTAIDAQGKAAYDTQKGALELGIQTGQVVSPVTIMNSNMNDAHKADLLSALNSKLKDTGNLQVALADYANGTLKVDPYSSDARKTVDALQAEIERAVPPAEVQTATENLIAQSGVVPQKTLNSIRAGLESTNPAQVEAAAQQASRIAQINPAALARRDGGSEVQKKADDFNYYVNNLNLSPSDAARKIVDNNTPEKQRERKFLEPAAKEFKKLVEKDDIGSMFDESWLPFNDPDVGFNEGQALGIQAEYLAIAEEQFYQANGNVDLAKNRAKEEMKRLYGVTEMSERKVVMKHPPERYWPSAANGEPFQYAKTQLFQDLYALDPAIDRSTVQFVTTPETDAMIKRGELPAYAVFYADKEGVLQTLPGQLWRPSLDGMKANDRAMQEQSIGAARELDAVRFSQQTDGRAENAAASQAIDATVGPDWMKARSAEAARETTRMQNDAIRSQTPSGKLINQRNQLFNDAQQNGLLTEGGN